jgi:hypothetical protein
MRPAPSLITDKHRELLREKGVRDHVIDGATERPRYVSYAAGDKETVARWADEWNPNGHHLTQINPGSKGWASRVINSDHGLIIVRRGLSDVTWEPAGMRGSNPWVESAGPPAQIRPDNPLPWMNNGGKYLWHSCPDGSWEKSIDVHPLSREPFRSGEGRVYFALEGSINGDSIVSHGGIAISVGGVTQWRAPRLWEFGRLLQGREVWVVSDNDWRPNEMVATQARLCAKWLSEQYGALAVHAAPPWDPQSPKKGVGDFLNEGGTLGQLEVVRPPDKERLQALIRARIPEQFQHDCLYIVDSHSDSPAFSTPRRPDGGRWQTGEHRMRDMEGAGIVKRLVEAQRKNEFFRDRKPKFTAKAARWEWL